MWPYDYCNDYCTNVINKFIQLIQTVNIQGRNDFYVCVKAIFIPTKGCNSNVSQISKCTKIVQGLKNDGDNLIIVSLPLHFTEVCVHHLKAVVKHMIPPLIKRSKCT